MYSSADRGGLHARSADEAIEIGPAPAAESYLDAARIIDAARRARADAVHPGYGFLSETTELAQACLDAGLIYVGPGIDALAVAGDKSRCRSLARTAGVPVLPGYNGEDQRDETLRSEADALGFPLLIKAAAGGGGRGIRVVRAADELADALAAARREAAASFGDDRVILERYLEAARHVEVQVLGDQHGSVMHLGERDCSVQRRHQKVAEEAPAPDLSEATRSALHSSALTLAGALRYTNAGTCEFLVDGGGQHYFIEMNARLQVEHPVTEAVTGLDLVALQLAVADGERLASIVPAVSPRGHAIELRLFAEDPGAGFQPDPARIESLRLPNGRGIRHDMGYAAGDTVPPHYDAMVGKLIVHGETRDHALRTAGWALEHYEVAGPRTNLSFLRWLVSSPGFSAGGVPTSYLADHWHVEPTTPPTAEAVAAAALATALRPAAAGSDAWTRIGHWRAACVEIPISLQTEGARQTAWLTRLDTGSAGDHWRCRVGTAELTVRADGDSRFRIGTRANLADGTVVARVEQHATGVTVELNGVSHRFETAAPPTLRTDSDTWASDADGVVRAPVPGRISRLTVHPGAHVAPGQVVAIVESMKIEHTVAAGRAATVTSVGVSEGDWVERGAAIAHLTPE